MLKSKDVIIRVHPLINLMCFIMWMVCFGFGALCLQYKMTGGAFVMGFFGGTFFGLFVMSASPHKGERRE